MSVALFIAAVLALLVPAGVTPDDSVLGGPPSIVAGNSAAPATGKVTTHPPSRFDSVLGGPPSK